MEEPGKDRKSSTVPGLCWGRCAGTRLPQLQAASAGHVDCLMKTLDWAGLLDRRGRWEALEVDDFGATALHVASRRDRIDCLRCLVKHAYVVESVRANNGATPLHDAAATGSLRCLRYLISHTKCSVDDRDANGSTPLHWAVQAGQMAAITELVEDGGAAVDATTKNGVTPLHFAAAKGRLEALKYLTSYEKTKTGCYRTVNSQAKSGASPSYFAAQEGRLECLRHLVETCGADPSLAATDEMTCLLAAAQEGHLNCLQWLVESGNVPANQQGPDKTTAAHLAASQGHVHCVKWLLQSGKFSGKERDDFGGTMAHDAAEHGQLQVLRLLHELGVHIDRGDHDGSTPLQLAQKNGHSDCVSFLKNVREQKRQAQLKLEAERRRAEDAKKKAEEERRLAEQRRQEEERRAREEAERRAREEAERRLREDRERRQQEEAERKWQIEEEKRQRYEQLREEELRRLEFKTKENGDIPADSTDGRGGEKSPGHEGKERRGSDSKEKNTALKRLSRLIRRTTPEKEATKEGKLRRRNSQSGGLSRRSSQSSADAPPIDTLSVEGPEEFEFEQDDETDMHPAAEEGQPQLPAHQAKGLVKKRRSQYEFREKETARTEMKFLNWRRSKSFDDEGAPEPPPPPRPPVPPILEVEANSDAAQKTKNRRSFVSRLGYSISNLASSMSSLLTISSPSESRTVSTTELNLSRQPSEHALLPSTDSGLPSPTDSDSHFPVLTHLRELSPSSVMGSEQAPPNSKANGIPTSEVKTISLADALFAASKEERQAASAENKEEMDVVTRKQLLKNELNALLYTSASSSVQQTSIVKAAESPPPPPGSAPSPEELLKGNAQSVNTTLLDTISEDAEEDVPAGGEGPSHARKPPPLSQSVVRPKQRQLPLLAETDISPEEVPMKVLRRRDTPAPGQLSLPLSTDFARQEARQEARLRFRTARKRRCFTAWRTFTVRRLELGKQLHSIMERQARRQVKTCFLAWIEYRNEVLYKRMINRRALEHWQRQLLSKTLNAWCTFCGITDYSQSRQQMEKIAQQMAEKRQSFLQWLNGYLSADQHATNLAKDLSDGVLISKALHVLTGKQAPRLIIKPQLEVQRIDNWKSVLLFMGQLGIGTPVLRLQGLVDGDEYYIQRVLEHIRRWQATTDSSEH